MSWIVREEGFDPQRITNHGSKFMTGNGYMGYRGTLEEFSKEQLTAVTLAGVYDQIGTKWREPVNAPNGLRTRLFADGAELSVLNSAVEKHVQELDIARGVHARETVYLTEDGARVTFRSERFVSMDQLHLIANRFTIHSDKDVRLTLETGIDGGVWDINGPHLKEAAYTSYEGTLTAAASTQELGIRVAVAECLAGPQEGQEEIAATEDGIIHRILLTLQAGSTYEWVKYVSVYTSLDDAEDALEAAVSSSRSALNTGYDALLQSHEEVWEQHWALSDVEIEGDDEAQHALRFSIYQLLIIAPAASEKVSIPARGLSGQVYKGAVFWDTEMFMLPFFLYTQPEIARNIMMYRKHTLDGARRKAAEYGYNGAYYAWESQDSGDDACTLFNITDVFTGRPMRTYFRDKQIHISADVAHGIWEYYKLTGDTGFLIDGGAEVIWECARFFYAYAGYYPLKRRYELLDVTGPDEYHERVHNNAFTNYMARHTLRVAVQMMDELEQQAPELYAKLAGEREGTPGLQEIREIAEQLYVPQPDAQTGVIEQFDRYFQLEDPSLQELKARILQPNEYLGGGNGIATTTQIIKQADVVLLMHLFKDEFAPEIKKANWEFYEPRTEHGSSLSPCVYALVASDIGMPDWAYPYFKRTATIDLTGDSKQYVGDLYIGGTHPAANGGAWMAAVLGFGGLQADEREVRLNPALPSEWSALGFKIRVRGQAFDIRITREDVRITSPAGNASEQPFRVEGRETLVRPGQSVTVSLKGLAPAGGSH
ncbi:glycoside hydrolase family 65 protein [Paenibacillus sp. HJL G12]|uniref:Glycoside hydrolase family 65 protein n=1 Tax=Paenibacillus dendrobii TaxID=2691084 RepID=A0A7X3IKE2_9BACL|nr:glycoside hydrolase family 65 protein [Paenibacillus dendrobii]MWV45564.1 glycoside hydrolase family 65 protein [Paenibacillus dendrobii]